MQDPKVTVDISKSGAGLFCVPLTPQGGPEAIAELSTPSGNPFRTAPPDQKSRVEGSVISFLMRNPKGHAKLIRCVVNTRRGGAEATFVVAGDAEWLKAARPEADSYAALAATFPQIPEVWLREAAVSLHRQAAADDITVRCALPAITYLHSRTCCCRYHRQ